MIWRRRPKCPICYRGLMQTPKGWYCTWCQKYRNPRY